MSVRVRLVLAVVPWLRLVLRLLEGLGLGLGLRLLDLEADFVFDFEFDFDVDVDFDFESLAISSCSLLRGAGGERRVTVREMLARRGLG